MPDLLEALTRNNAQSVPLSAEPNEFSLPPTTAPVTPEQQAELDRYTPPEGATPAFAAQQKRLLTMGASERSAQANTQRKLAQIKADRQAKVQAAEVNLDHNARLEVDASIPPVIVDKNALMAQAKDMYPGDPEGVQIAYNQLLGRKQKEVSERDERVKSGVEEVKGRIADEYQSKVATRARNMGNEEFKKATEFGRLQDMVKPYTLQSPSKDMFRGPMHTWFMDIDGEPTYEFKKRVFDLAGANATPAKMKEAALAIVKGEEESYVNTPSEYQRAIEQIHNTLRAGIPSTPLGIGTSGLSGKVADAELQAVQEGLRGIGESVAAPMAFGGSVFNKDKTYGEAFSQITDAIHSVDPESAPVDPNILDHLAQMSGFIAPMAIRIPGVGALGESQIASRLTNALKLSLKSPLVATSIAPTLMNSIQNRALLGVQKSLQALEGSGAINYLDNTIGFMKGAGPAVFSGYYDELIEQGFDPKEAEEKAGVMTMVNSAMMSGPRSFMTAANPRVRQLAEKVMSERAGQNMLMRYGKAVASNAAYGAVEGGSAGLADAYQRFQNDKDLGIVPEDAQFNWGDAVKNVLPGARVNGVLAAIVGTVNKHGVAPADPQAQAITEAIADRRSFNSDVARRVSRGKMTPEQGSMLTDFLDRVEPSFKDAVSKGLSPDVAVKHAVETERLKETEARMLVTPDDPTLPELADKSRRTIKQLEDGTYIGNRTVTGQEMRDMAERTGATPVQAKGVVDNGPYKAETIPVETFAQDEAIQRILAQMDNPEAVGAYAEEIAPLKEERDAITEKHKEVRDGRFPDRIIQAETPMTEKETEELAKIKAEIARVEQRYPEFDKDSESVVGFQEPSAPVVVSKEGKVIDGKKRVAKAIKDGAKEIEVVRPVTPEETDATITDAMDNVVGIPEPNYEGLSKKNQADMEAAVQQFGRYADPVDAHTAAAQVLERRGVTRPKAAEIIRRITEGAIPQPIAEAVVSQVGKGERKADIPLSKNPTGEELVQHYADVDEAVADTPVGSQVFFDDAGTPRKGTIVEDAPDHYKVESVNPYDKRTITHRVPKSDVRKADDMVGAAKVLRNVAQSLRGRVESNERSAIKKAGFGDDRVIARGFELVADAIEGGAKLSKAISQAIKKMRLEFKEGFDPDTFERNVRRHFMEATGSIKGNIRRETSELPSNDKVYISEYEALKSQLKMEGETANQIDFNQKEFARTIANKLRSAERGGLLTDWQAKNLMAKAAGVGTSEARMDSFLEAVDSVMDASRRGDNIREAVSLQSRIKKAAKSEKTFSDHIDVLDAMARIPLRNLSGESIDEYRSLAKTYFDSRRALRDSSYEPFNTADALDRLGKIQLELNSQAISLAEEMTGIPGLSADEAKELIAAMESGNVDDFAANLDQSKQKAIRDRLVEQASYAQMGVESAMADPAFADAVPERGRALLKVVKDADLSKMTPQQLATFTKTLDNVVTNGGMGNVGKVYDIVKSQEGIAKLKESGIGAKLFQLNKLQESFESLPLLLKSLYGRTELASKFRNYTGFDKVFNGGSKTEQQLNSKYKKWEKYRKANGIGNSASDRYERSMYAMLVQHGGGSPSEINEQFLTTKSKIEQSISRLSERKSMQDMAKRLQEIYDVEFAPYQTLDEMQRAYDPAHPKQVEAVKFFQDAFAGAKEDLKFITEAYANERFEDVHNYTPLSYKYTGTEALAEPSSNSLYSNDRYAAKPKQNPSSITRTTGKVIPTDMALDFDFDANMFNKFKKAMYDINTIEGRSLFSEISKDKGFAQVVGGGDNKQRIIKQYNKAQANQAGNKTDSDIAGEIISGIINPVKNIGTSLTLGGITQLPKQYISVMGKAMLTLGNDMPIMLDVIKNAKIKDIPLLQLSSISARGERLGGIDLGNKLSIEQRAQITKGTQKAGRILAKFSERGRELSLTPLKYGDAKVAEQSWLAYYMKYMKDHGQPVKASDLPTEHERIDPLREDAMSYAQQMIDESQVVSNAALQSEFNRMDGNAWKEFLKAVLLPFNSFSSNMRARMVEDVKFIRYGDEAQRSEAIKDLSGNIVEAVSYQGLRLAIVFALSKYGIGGVLDYVFGDYDSDMSQEEKDKDWNGWVNYQLKQAKTNVVKDAVISGFGNPIENGFVDIINGLAYARYSEQHPDENLSFWEFTRGKKEEHGLPGVPAKSPLSRYYSGHYGIQDYAGLLGIAPKEASTYYQDVKGAFSGDYLNEYSYNTERRNKAGTATYDVNTNAQQQLKLSEEEWSYMIFVSIFDGLAAAGVRDADWMRAIQQRKQNMLKAKRRKE